MKKLLQKNLFTVYCLLLTAYLLPGNAYPPGWSDDILISPDTNHYRERPDVNTDSQNNVWVVWDSTGFGGGYIYYSKRDSLGAEIIPETRASTSSISHYCRLEVDYSDNVHVIWREWSPLGYGLGYTKLANDGSVIIPAHLVLDGAGGGGPLTIEMVLDRENYAHIIWEETPSFFEQVNYTLLDSLGDTVISKVQVSAVDTSGYYPGIAVDSAGNNHIVYRSDSPPIERIVYTKLDKYGNVLVPNQVISTGSSPSVICDYKQNVHIFYRYWNIASTDIYYIKLDNNGAVLLPPTRISLPTDSSNYLCHTMIDAQQYLHIVWETARFQQSAWILYTKMDTEGNVIISPTDIVYPPYTFWALFPRITVDESDKLHLVWADGRPDTVLRIYYKRGENEAGIDETVLSKAVHPTLSALPNPFSNSTTIQFSKEHNSKRIELKIFDITGRLVKEFDQLTNHQSPVSQVSWNGTDNVGKRLPAGVYFVQYEEENSVGLKKIVKSR